MMRIETSKGKTYEADWIDESTISGNVNLQIVDSRRLPEIAEDFDGLEYLKRTSETQGDKRYDGYKKLMRISAEVDGRVWIAVGKE